MAKIILTESHEDVLKSHGYKYDSAHNTNQWKNYGRSEYKHPSGHTITVYSNGSWAHHNDFGHHVHSVSNPDNGILLKDYLQKYYRGE